jgi:hypothetical protein
VAGLPTGKIQPNFTVDRRIFSLREHHNKNRPVAHSRGGGRFAPEPAVCQAQAPNGALTRKTSTIQMLVRRRRQIAFAERGGDDDNQLAGVFWALGQ